MIQSRIGISMNADMVDGSVDRLHEHLGYIEGSGARWAEMIFHGLDVVVNGRLDSAQVRRIRATAARHDLRYSLHLPYVLNLLDPVRGAIYTDVFRAGLQFASELHMPVVVYHASSATLSPERLERHYYPRYGNKQTDLIWRLLREEEAQALGQLADEAQALGVSIGVENPMFADEVNVRSYGAMPEDLAEHVGALGRKNVGVTLDFGHLFLSSVQFGFDYLQGVRTLAPRTIHTHVHDNFGTRDPGGPYIQRLPYGLGDLHQIGRASCRERVLWQV